MIETLLVSAAANSVASLLPLIESYLKRRKAGEDVTELTVKSRGGEIQVPTEDVRDLSDEDLEAIIEIGSREVSKEKDPKELSPEEAAEAGATASLVSPSAVFEQARRRIRFLFTFRVGVLVTVVVILLAALIGVILAVATGESGLAVGIGVFGIADLAAAWIYKPLEKLHGTLLDTQRLEAAHAATLDQLRLCRQYPTVEEQFQCARQVWSSLFRELAEQQA